MGGSAVEASEPIDAGSSGERLRLLFDPPNDGTSEEVTAEIVNGQPETFEHALVVFHVPAAGAPYEVDAGDLFQTVIEGGTATCYVRVSATASSTTEITISPATASEIDEDGVPALALVGHAFPNPSRARVGLSFSLGRAGPVSVEIVDVSGRVVRILRDGACPDGTHDVEWDLTDERGVRVAAGVYFCRIASTDTCLTEKIVALR